MMFQNVSLELKWSEYSLTDASYSTPISPMPVNLKIQRVENALAKFIVIIQPIFLLPNTKPPSSNEKE